MMKNKFIIVATIFWVIAYCIFMKFAIKWDNDKYLEAQDMYGDVADNSAEAYYP